MLQLDMLTWALMYPAAVATSGTYEPKIVKTLIQELREPEELVYVKNIVKNRPKTTQFDNNVACSLGLCASSTERTSLVNCNWIHQITFLPNLSKKRNKKLLRTVSGSWRTLLLAWSVGKLLKITVAHAQVFASLEVWYIITVWLARIRHGFSWAWFFTLAGCSWYNDMLHVNKNKLDGFTVGPEQNLTSASGHKFMAGFEPGLHLRAHILAPSCRQQKPCVARIVTTVRTTLSVFFIVSADLKAEVSKIVKTDSQQNRTTPQN